MNKIRIQYVNAEGRTYINANKTLLMFNCCAYFWREFKAS